MARDLGEDIHKIFELPIKGISNILWYLVLLSCQQSGCPRSVRKRNGRKRTTMEKTENQNNVTADPTILNYANPYFV